MKLDTIELVRVEEEPYCLDFVLNGRPLRERLREVELPLEDWELETRTFPRPTIWAGPVYGQGIRVEWLLAPNLARE